MSNTPFTTFVAPGFETVAQAFKANFEDGLEHGASFAAYKDGKLIVDLLGGWKDRQKTMPLATDSLIAVFSSGKVAAALVIAYLADEDRLGYDQKVASFWKGFEAQGKGDLTIAQVMSHQAGLSGITNLHWTPEDWFDWDKTCAELAGQEPIWEPGTACGYHPVTYGFLAGQIAKLTDRYGRTLGEIMKQDMCGPHDLDVWIGLPESEHRRCAEMIKPRKLADMGEINDATRAAFLQKWSSPGRKGTKAWREAELAGSNCHATAKSMAQMMRMLIDGNIGDEKFLAEDILQAIRKPRISGLNLVLPFDITFAAGIMLNEPNFFYGPNPNTLGHSGWGGSCVFADPDTGITGCYAMTQQDNSLLGDKRPRRIIDALYNCL